MHLTQEEIDDMAGRHGRPSTGTGKAGGHGAKPKKSQVTVKTNTGTTLWGATAKLFGISSDKKKK